MFHFFKGWRKAPRQSEGSHLGFHPSPDVKASRHPDGVVLIHRSRGTVFSANRVGAIIWTGAAEGHSLDQLSHSISHEFHIPPADAQQDAAQFLAELAAEGLLVADAN